VQKYELFDKLVLLFCSIIISFILPLGVWHVLPLLIALIFAGIATLLNDKIWRGAIIFLFCAMCWRFPMLNPFIPLMIYTTFDKNRIYMSLIYILPLALNFANSSPMVFSVVALSFVSILLVYRTTTHSYLRQHYLALLDSSRELGIEIKSQNKALLESQDDKVKLATLNERNRIAREIHDHVGHRLSSAFLQIGAILSQNPDDNRIILLKDTLNLAMDSIRQSVHDLHDSSIDITAIIEDLAQKLTCSKVELNISIDKEPEVRIKNALISSVKEAFSNIAKHSDADKVQLNLIEHPVFYQLTIHDNGKNINLDLEKGIGLNNIRERVESAKGYFRIKTDSGFEIFISMPKEGI